MDRTDVAGFLLAVDEQNLFRLSRQDLGPGQEKSGEKGGAGTSDIQGRRAVFREQPALEPHGGRGEWTGRGGRADQKQVRNPGAAGSGKKILHRPDGKVGLVSEGSEGSGPDAGQVKDGGFVNPGQCGKLPVRDQAGPQGLTDSS